jgi:hypothetical protein
MFLSSPATQGSTNSRTVGQASSGINQDSISKITNSKDRGTVQEVECLPSKCKVLSSNPYYYQKKNGLYIDDDDD